MTWYDTIDLKTDSWCPVGRRVGRGVGREVAQMGGPNGPIGPLFVHGGIIWLQ